MKWFLVLILCWTFSALGMTHKDFVNLSRDKRERVITAYKEFIKEYSKTVEVSSATPMSFPQFIEAAYASEASCMYGGWPSTRVNGLCSLPRSNPSFQRESCGQGQMPCQPLLFGRGVCVPNATRAQKRSAFASCEMKFQSMGRNLANVVEYISDPEVGAEADELFRLVDEICRTGAQASTPMCRNLKRRVEEIKAARPAQPATRTVDANADLGQSMGVTLTSRSEVSGLTVAQQAGQLEENVRHLNQSTRCPSCEAQRVQTTDEPERAEPESPAPETDEPAEADDVVSPAPVTSPSGYPRMTSGFDLAACGRSRSHPDGYELKYIGNCRNYNNGITPAGFAFRPGQGHQYMNVQTRYPNGSAPGRFFEMASRNQAFNETYLMMEEYGGGPDSHNVKSYMFVIPRVTVPSVRALGDNLVLTLPTGETVTMNKSTREITGGALTEGPIDLNTDRFQRRPPNIHYNGSGISIRLDHRYEHPLTGSATATVKQGNRTCTVQRSAILDANGMLMTQSDADLLAVLNRSCRGGGFRLP